MDLCHNPQYPPSLKGGLLLPGFSSTGALTKESRVVHRYIPDSYTLQVRIQPQSGKLTGKKTRAKKHFNVRLELQRQYTISTMLAIMRSLNLMTH